MQKPVNYYWRFLIIIYSAVFGREEAMEATLVVRMEDMEVAMEATVEVRMEVIVEARKEVMVEMEATAEEEMQRYEDYVF
jgi:hypothetical protein